MKNKESKVQLIKGTGFGSGSSNSSNDLEIIDLHPQFREEPYTPIKKVVDIVPKDNEKIKDAIDNAIKTSINKKIQLKDWMYGTGRV